MLNKVFCPFAKRGALMTDTKEILKKIAALRLRLDQAKTTGRQSTVHEVQPAVLEEMVVTGTRHSSLLDGTLRQISNETTSVMPARLTARGARLLKRGRDLLHQLREMLEDPLLRAADDDPLTELHVEIASMLDVLLRTVQAFPPSAGAQLRLCEGLEAAQEVIEERLGVLNAGLTHRRRETGLLDQLADLFRKLGAGQNINPQGILLIVEELRKDIQTNQPVRFLYAAPEDPARFVAAHSLTAAQVLGRYLQHDPDWRERLEEALFATLLHDVGMLRVPAEVLASRGPLTDEQRRLVERHPNVGAHMISRILPGGGLFVEAATDHHERVDGTGYPAGRRDVQLSTFARILAICDVYAALAAPRPYRAALETRAAMTDTLLLADQGALDRDFAEKLLGLSFYPVGSVVELSDGAIGYVLATHPGQKGVLHPAKPIVCLLSGPRGQVLAFPSVVDLADDTRSIVRSLPRAEKRKLLLGRYPELV